MKIEYPVVIDNQYAIWRAFRNQYWPALYFLDGRGRVRHQPLWRGRVQRSEATIQHLMAEAGLAEVLGGGAVSVVGEGVEAAADWDNLKSPEAYVGYDRLQNFASRGGPDFDRRRVYAAPTRMALNQWALAGEWSDREARHRPQPSERADRPSLSCARPASRHGPGTSSGRLVRFRVSLDGQPPGAARGLDVDEDGHGTVADHRMYQLVRQPRPIVDRTFEIEFLDAGVEAFAFTFG